ncbi:hypothetical protein HUG20_13035 [Salicibibacter cibi]|uniref:Uncharacterized protein n=1 Tax=Salicibibacter cibi TaxID=2743001 RepID=A0A7T6ZCD0_9BACI|nr:hypothetical protein [Salicibibacter cibi]QQK80727.1 hypothetical protein HUG20_13035 [Salicibibacter cibi]
MYKDKKVDATRVRTVKFTQNDTVKHFAEFQKYDLLPPSIFTLPDSIGKQMTQMIADTESLRTSVFNHSKQLNDVFANFTLSDTIGKQMTQMITDTESLRISLFDQAKQFNDVVTDFPMSDTIQRQMSQMAANFTTFDVLQEQANRMAESLRPSLLITFNEVHNQLRKLGDLYSSEINEAFRHFNDFVAEVEQDLETSPEEEKKQFNDIVQLLKKCKTLIQVRNVLKSPITANVLMVLGLIAGAPKEINIQINGNENSIYIEQEESNIFIEDNGEENQLKQLEDETEERQDS